MVFNKACLVIVIVALMESEVKADCSDAKLAPIVIYAVHPYESDIIELKCEKYYMNKREMSKMVPSYMNFTAISLKCKRY